MNEKFELIIFNDKHANQTDSDRIIRFRTHKIWAGSANLGQPKILQIFHLKTHCQLAIPIVIFKKKPTITSKVSFANRSMSADFERLADFAGTSLRRPSPRPTYAAGSSLHRRPGSCRILTRKDLKLNSYTNSYN